MHIAVIATESQKQIWSSRGIADGHTISWLTEPQFVEGTDTCIDLQFQHDPLRIAQLQQFFPARILVNEVTESCPESFARMNGWPGFLQSEQTECCCVSEMENAVKEIVSVFNRTVCFVNDQPGLITARVVAMIINEAYITLEENVSTRQEIDTAMKSGTNYPFGPFEWCSMIGPQKVAGLLNRLTLINSRYQPAAALLRETEKI